MLLPPEILIAAIIIIALIFDFTNGFHDAANAISTVISTKVLTPRKAVIFAAFFNFVAAFVMGVAVASTMAHIVNLNQVAASMIPYIILGALLAAIAWNIFTWKVALPTSSSHALIGGLVGAGISAAGVSVIHWETIGLTIAFMVVSAIVGLVAGYLFMVLLLRTVRGAPKVKADYYFKKLQLCSAALFSFSHGSNDAQKTVGIILPLLFSIGYFGASADTGNLPVPPWVIIACYGAISLGTLSGGMRIVKTMGYKIMKVRPVHGFAAETASAMTIIGATLGGIPVSTTQVISSAIMGVGSTSGVHNVGWGVGKRILWAWVLTIPLSAGLGFLIFRVISLFM
ncbi:MAG: anion permease [Methanomicrobiales archaeon HGW-Methanomicrobiales-1]|jgi:PiT family inorganic phosphate transporter|nr:MAG: anion permease [Methanomicrobiales archaeon HGW-Methanomicrobiales-1]